VRFSIVLTRNGNVAITSERTRHKATTCWTYVFDNDRAGNQRYCSTVSARVGSHSLVPVTRCEEEASP
jgi:L,D-peptidoglycan transpeptidase YkuD (ErfK/YbiS/YcfS/YnhG family)